MTTSVSRRTVNRDREALAHFRALFPYPEDAAFLNHASHAPLNERARVRASDMIRRLSMNLDNVDKESFELAQRVRDHCASLIKAQRGRIALTNNTTDGFNMVLWALNLKRGDEILMAEVEFPALVYACRGLAEQLGVKLTYLPCPNGHIDEKALKSALKRRRVRVLAISWVQYFNGYRYDIEAITKLAHKHGVFVLVDAIQIVGTMPLDVRRAGIDALSCGAQKWLLSQTGSGFVYIAPNPIRKVQPRFRGWLGVDWQCKWDQLRDRNREFCKDGRRWEGGTYNYVNIRYTIAGLELIRAAKLSRIARRIQYLHQRIEKGLSDSPVQFTSDHSKAHRSAIFTFSGPRLRALYRHLHDHRIIVSLRENAIRVSPHFYNTDDEIDLLTECVNAYYKKKPPPHVKPRKRSRKRRR